MGLALVISALACSYGHAKTLIVTHPDRKYDVSNATGRAIRKLLLDETFHRKVVLISGEPLTFSTNGLNFESRTSENGELVWTSNDPEIFLAGGYFEACFQKTLIDLIKYSDPSINLNIHAPIKAIYTTRLIFPERAPGYKTKMFENSSSMLGSQNIEVLFFDAKRKKLELDGSIPGLADEILNSEELTSSRIRPLAESLTVRILLNGRLIAVKGHGPQIISLNFERKI